jgi:hypothetical protein
VFGVPISLISENQNAVFTSSMNYTAECAVCDLVSFSVIISAIVFVSGMFSKGPCVKGTAHRVMLLGGGRNFRRRRWRLLGGL